MIVEFCLKLSLQLSSEYSMVDTGNARILFLKSKTAPLDCQQWLPSLKLHVKVTFCVKFSFLFSFRN